MGEGGLKMIPLIDSLAPNVNVVGWVDGWWEHDHVFRLSPATRRVQHLYKCTTT